MSPLYAENQFAVPKRQVPCRRHGPEAEFEATARQSLPPRNGLEVLKPDPQGPGSALQDAEKSVDLIFEDEPVTVPPHDAETLAEPSVGAAGKCKGNHG